MEATDLSSVEAALWVWESLWSARRHAKMDILDTATFDDERNTDAATTLSRWIFTAKDGRVVKKSSINTSVGALKQALLGRVLRGTPNDGRDSRVAGNMPGEVFANALLKSGKSVQLDEEAWASLIVRGGLQGGGIAAVTAMVPNNDSSGLRRGSRQRVICEYRVAVGHSDDSNVNHSSAKPLHASMQTYVVVSSSLLRQTDDQNQVCSKSEDSVADKAYVGGRLLSKSKPVNREVGAKMDRIVHWLQEVRRVHVLAMTATFIVLPSAGNSSPIAWLERALDIRIVPKKSSSELRAPIAGTSLIPPKQSCQGHGDRRPRESRCAINPGKPNKSEDAASDESGETSSRQWCDPPSDNTSKTKSVLASAPDVAGTPNAPSDSDIRRSKPDKLGSSSATFLELKSTTKILSAATDTTPSTPETTEEPQLQGSGNTVQSHQDRPSLMALSPHCHHSEHPVACPDSARGNCVGDFCAYRGQSKPSRPKFTKKGHIKTGDVVEVDWADINACSGNGTLLEISKRSTPRKEDAKNGGMYSLSFKSIGLARGEANEDRDLYWDESLRKYWEEGRRGLQGVGPASADEEALVCRTCYEVYRRLDKLREQVDRSRGAQERRDVDMLPVMEGIAESNRRAAVAEASAAKMGEEVAAIVKKVNARIGKPGIQGGKSWRRILSKNKGGYGVEVDKARSQAVLSSILAKPKSQPKAFGGEKANLTLPLGDKKRPVKSQGDTPGHADKPCSSQASARCSFPTLRRRQGPRATLPKRMEGDRSNCVSLPLGKSRRIAWSPQNYLVGGDISGSHDGRIISQLPSVRGDSPGVADSGIRKESRTTIKAIEAMLQKGSESYLPMCAQDLPEATAVLGSHRNKGDEDEGKQHRLGERLGSKKKSNRGEDRRESEVSERKTSRRFSEERFLHPWQRSLEAVKRSSGRTAEYEAALKSDQHRRQKALKAARESKYCQRARQRIIARLGHRRQRSHRRKYRSERVGGMNLPRKHAKDDPQINDGEISDPGLYSKHENRNRDGSAWPDNREAFNGDEGPAGDMGYIGQMREALGCARKTFETLLKRLRGKGFAVEDVRRVDEAKHGEVVRLVEEIQKYLATFENTGLTLGAEAAALASLANNGEKKPSPEFRCEAACEAFETEFSRLVHELTSAAKTHLCDPESTCLDTKHSCSDPCTDRLRLEIRSPSRSQTKTTPKIRILCFGVCPSCSILPVARRCLDCKGDGADRDRCAGCFVVEHREPSRRNHRFLRISGERVSSTVTPTYGTDGTGQKNALQGEKAGAPAISSRCSRCGDIAAARHCRDCGVDMCAACHFLTHRTPSRQAHVTEFVGETAVAMQESLYGKLRAGSIQEEGGAIENAPPLEISPGSGDSTEQTGDVGSNTPRGIGRNTGRVALQQSLAQVQSTVSTSSQTSTSSLRGTPSSITEQKSGATGGGSYSNGEYGDDRPPSGGNDCLSRRVKGSGAEADACIPEDVENNNDTNIRLSDSIRVGVMEGNEGDTSERKGETDSKSDGYSWSSEEDDSEEGMMWSPLNIATVDVEATVEEEGNVQPPPSPTKAIDIDRGSS